MISASHNPYADNGIKLFGPDGYKLSDEIEAQIEAQVTAGIGARAPSNELGRARRLEDAGGRYIEFVKSSLPRRLRFDGLRVVVDCANGAAYKVAPTVLWELGAEVFPIGVSPDGLNINRESGAVSTAAMQREVTARRADLGIALDGDADRLIIVDEHGKIVDGDQLMGLIATCWKKTGRLAGGGIVATVMSNLGLERHLGGEGLALHRAKVGDRYVLEDMLKRGCNLGGEQSGHIILSDHTTTGDGLIAALQVMAAIVELDKPASSACRIFEPVPQLLRNVRFAGGAPLETKVVQAAIADAERRLAGTGRLLIRKSGTEPLIRVMAEGEDEGLVAEIVDELCAVIRSSSGAEVQAAE
jgi:phosphoglucosamine mutase